MKKTISMLLALIMLFSVLSVGASALAVPELPAHEPLRDIQALRYTPDAVLPERTPEYSVNRFASGDPNAPYTFYSQLPTTLSRDIYNGLLNGEKPQAENVITLSQPITAACAIQGDMLNVPDEVWDVLTNGLFAAASALMDDHPEMFWIGDFAELNFGCTKDPVYNSNYTSVTLEIDTVLVTYKLPKGYADWNGVKTAYNQMMQVADSVPIVGATRFEKLKSIHDWIAKRVEYDDDGGSTCYEATSVFLAPYKTVCEGYSEAFKMLCDRAGIPCIVVVGYAGEAHAWNYVKMEDGNWYAVDVTWDDQNAENGDDIIFYDFFLRGANSVDIFFTEASFETTHTPLGDRYVDKNGNAVYSLTYPALAKEGYTRMILAPNAQATVDKSTMTVYLPDGTDIADAVVIPDGYKGYAPPDEPILQITQIVNGRETLVEEYKIVYLKAGRLGDVNGDGYVDATDARWVLQAAAEIRTLTEAQKIAANVNGDASIDATDARWILQAAADLRTLPAA